MTYLVVLAEKKESRDQIRRGNTVSVLKQIAFTNVNGNVFKMLVQYYNRLH